MHRSSAAPRSLSLPGKVHDDRTHDARGVAIELTFFLAVQLTGLDEAHETFMHQNRGIEQRIASAVAQLSARQRAQFVISHHEQFLARRVIACLRLLQQQSESAHADNRLCDERALLIPNSLADI